MVVRIQTAYCTDKRHYNSLLFTKKRGTCIKAKNYRRNRLSVCEIRRLSQKLTKIRLFTTKIINNYRILSKIIAALWTNFGYIL